MKDWQKQILKMTEGEPTPEVFKPKTMQRKTVIIVVDENQNALCFGNLKKACNHFNWVYNTLVQKKLPLVIEGNKLQRIDFK